MPRVNKLLATASAFAVVACSGGGGGGGAFGGGPTAGAPTPTPSTAPTPTPSSTACSLAARKAWVLDQFEEWYLFPELLDAGVNAASYNDLQAYIDALVAPARAQSKDRHFSYITSIAEEDALINSGATAGFGFRLSYFNDGGLLRVFVNESFEGTSALAANVDRGDELVGVATIGGSMLLVHSLPATNASVAQVIDAMGPDTAGTQRVLRIQRQGGGLVDVTMAKTNFALDPVSSRYGGLVLTNGATKVGYINLRTFIVSSAASELRQKFLEFKNQGITQVVVDLRYNGGGLVSVGRVLGSLMATNHAGDVFGYTTFRASKSNENSTDQFSSESSGIAAMKIAFIGTGGTASASELVMNAFPPYLHANVALIGSNTYGKPVGQIGLDNSACDDRLRVIAFKTENASHQGEYFTGLAATMPKTCAAADDIFHDFGDRDESSLNVALNWLSTGSCTPISSTAKTPQALGPRRQLMQPARPSASQAWLPGTF